VACYVIVSYNEEDQQLITYTAMTVVYFPMCSYKLCMVWGPQIKSILQIQQNGLTCLLHYYT